MATLNLQDISKKYKSASSIAVDGITARFETGEVIGIIGPNGAGKTTLFHLIAGSVTPDRGIVTFEKEGRHSSPRVALMLDGGGDLYRELSALENFYYFVGLSTGGSSPELSMPMPDTLRRLGLEEHCRKQVKTLSRGMQQRLSIAIALASSSEVLLLDEPTNGLDIEESQALFTTLKKLAAEAQRVILFSSHVPGAILDLADRVHFILRGKLVSEIVPEHLRQMDAKAFVERYLVAVNATN